ncbi:MAG: DUF362 domain-containing protein [Bacteroidales bacterium]|nr:MAG: DUF362 domain-containing protein [Bacteroidales bacterium]
MEKDKFHNWIERMKASFGRKKLPAKLVFIVLGVLSTIWFLVRVIPKPSRATYPCVKAAAPIMASFVIYLLSITGSVVAFRKFKTSLLRAKYLIAFVFLTAGILAVTVSIVTTPGSTKAFDLVPSDYYEATQPIGEAYGISPGRVVWMWDPNATDETCENVPDDYWFDNTDQAVVDNMLEKAIKYLAVQDSIADAWDALFRYFNKTHGNGDKGYTAGEKIYVKINLTNSSNGMSGTQRVDNFERMDATPELVLSILMQLIENAGVAQSDIYIGDPFRTFRDSYWDMCHTVYPDVNYCDGDGLNGRHKIQATTEDLMKFSDGRYDWRIPQEYVNATYFINMPCLKTHDSGGITLAAKNHQGSVLQDGAQTSGQSAWNMHYSLPDHDDTDGGNHRYRHLVDYIGHEHLGGKTMLNIVDGIWAGKSWQGWVEKWQMAPFNDDYPSSLFLSQDNLAIESVCFDFLLTEYENRSAGEKYSWMAGTSDYLVQAADPDNWAPGVTYDPEGDGSPLGSLGVYEHWNNAADMQYTRDLGTGDGIEFIKITAASPDDPVGINDKVISTADIMNLYPNPLRRGSLNIEISNSAHDLSEIIITDIKGRQIFSLRTSNKVVEIPFSTFTPGTYLVKVTAGKYSSVEKLIVE